MNITFIEIKMTESESKTSQEKKKLRKSRPRINNKLGKMILKRTVIIININGLWSS